MIKNSKFCVQYKSRIQRLSNKLERNILFSVAAHHAKLTSVYLFEN